jgi:hypothetical protein
MNDRESRERKTNEEGKTLPVRRESNSNDRADTSTARLHQLDGAGRYFLPDTMTAFSKIEELLIKTNDHQSQPAIVPITIKGNPDSYLRKRPQKIFHFRGET